MLGLLERFGSGYTLSSLFAEDDYLLWCVQVQNAGRPVPSSEEG